MKTTIDVPDDLMREIKMQAVMRGRPLKTLVADLLRRGLQAEQAEKQTPRPKPASARIMIDEHGLPSFRSSPDAPATKGTFTVDDALALEQRALEAEDLNHAGLSA
jgi:hypothetical protein